MSKILQEYIYEYERVMLDNKDRFFMSLRGAYDFKDEAPEDLHNIHLSQVKGTKIFKDVSNVHLFDNL